MWPAGSELERREAHWQVTDSSPWPVEQDISTEKAFPSVTCCLGLDPSPVIRRAERGRPSAGVGASNGGLLSEGHFKVREERGYT